MSDKKHDHEHGGTTPPKMSGKPGRKPHPAHPFDVDEMLKKQPQWVQDEINEIRKHEAKVLRALEDDQNKEQFTNDPAGLLRKLGVPLSGPLKDRLRADTSVRDLRKGICFSLPNGQAVTPRVRINFTK